MVPPNIVLILVDDLGWRDLGSQGSTFYETPILDALAASGMRFTDAYASCPVCSPSRASILTGKYPARLGVTNYIGGHARGKLLDAPYIDHLAPEEYSLARALHKRGYATWHVGKWHLGERAFFPDRHGFDVNIGGCGWGFPINGYFSPWGIETLADRRDGEYLTDRLTDEAVALIRSAGGNPFFLNMWYYAVHVPIQAPASLVDKYRSKARRLGIDRINAFEEGELFPCDHKKHLRVTRRRLQSDPAYAAMVENLDANVGRILTALEDVGQAQNTLFIFTSDNGGLATAEGSPTCNAPLVEGKGWMYEGGLRVPLLFRLPGVVPKGSVCTVPVTGPDLYSTVLEAVGPRLLPEQHQDGVSIWPLLRGGDALDRNALYWHFPHYGNQGGTPASAIRMGEYKLIEYFETGSVELYNLDADISEAHDLACEQPEICRKLQGLLREWRDEVGAKYPQVPGNAHVPSTP